MCKDQHEGLQLRLGYPHTLAGGPKTVGKLWARTIHDQGGDQEPSRLVYYDHPHMTVVVSIDTLYGDDKFATKMIDLARAYLIRRGYSLRGY